MTLFTFECGCAARAQAMWRRRIRECTNHMLFALIRCKRICFGEQFILLFMFHFSSVIVEERSTYRASSGSNAIFPDDFLPLHSALPTVFDPAEQRLSFANSHTARRRSFNKWNGIYVAESEAARVRRIDWNAVDFHVAHKFSNLFARNVRERLSRWMIVQLHKLQQQFGFDLALADNYFSPRICHSPICRSFYCHRLHSIATGMSDGRRGDRERASAHSLAIRSLISMKRWTRSLSQRQIVKSSDASRYDSHISVSLTSPPTFLSRVRFSFCPFPLRHHSHWHSI